MTASEVFSIALALLGGLGLFLFGMKTMSDEKEKTAGPEDGKSELSGFR